MKKIAFTLLMATLLFSCKKDDDGNTQVSVEGNWKLTAFTTETGFDFNEDGTASNNVMSETNCYQNETVLFSGNGSATSTNRSYADITLELVAGSTTEYEYSVTCVQETEINTLSWTQSGNTISITESGETITGTLSGSVLTIVIPSGFFVEVEETGGTGFTTEDVTFVYTKQ